MGETHAYAITLSPKGQVATARCVCGWMTKHRAADGATPEDRARSAGDEHLERAPAQDKQLVRDGLLVLGGHGAHQYWLATEDGGAVLATCSCGWKTTFRGSPTGEGQTVQQMAVEYSNRHVAHAAAVASERQAGPEAKSATPAEDAEHKLGVKPVGSTIDVIDATCTCGWNERHYAAGGKSGVKVAFDAHRKHVVEATPWTAGGVAVLVGMAAIVIFFFLMVGAFVMNLGSNDVDDSSDYSITDTGNRDDSDLCRRQKAWWADKENGEDVIAGMGDC